MNQKRSASPPLRWEDTVIRKSEFRISTRPYAVDLSGMAIKTHNGLHKVTVPAVWYRRRKGGKTVACIGHLWAYMRDPKPVDALAALERMNDGRYGGACLGRWDGKRYWGAQEPAVIEQHLAVLRPMLDAYPAVPLGYDGWWRYETDRERAAAQVQR